MRQILVLYGTTDGHTRKVAAALRTAFGDMGVRVDVVDARYAGRTCRPDGYDAVLVLASVHIHAFQRTVRRWVRRHSVALNRIPTAFAAVCLGILEHKPEVDAELHQVVARFLRATRWRPVTTTFVAGALRFTRYSWFTRRMMRRIAEDAGLRGLDTSRDHEFTDWQALREFAEQFAEGAGLARHADVRA